ncbi:MAG: MurR/RpiR family transcriptional regulator [Cellulosilyticaceae bacterium]
MNESILDDIQQQYTNLSKSEKRIANYVLANRSAVQYMTITTLAEECKVADATITRFCKKLGCSGYNNFKLSLAKNLSYTASDNLSLHASKEITSSDSILTMCEKLYYLENESLHQTFQSLDETSIATAIQFLCHAHQVYCFGQGGSSIMAMEAWGRFITHSSKFHWVQDSHMQAITLALLKADDVILYFCYSGATSEIMEDLIVAQKRGVKIILITRFYKSPAAAYADVILLCGGNESPLEMGSVPAKISQLFLIDILYTEFCRRNKDICLKNRDITTQVISKKLL